MVTVRPATVIVPVRCEGDALAAMAYRTEPLPPPVSPLVTVIHATELAAAQLHPAALVTERTPVVAAALAETAVGDTVYEQADPSCVTVMNWFAALNDAVRVVGVRLGSAARDTTPVPTPDPPAVMRSQDALVEPLHAQPACVVTVTSPVPPCAPDV